MPVPLFDVNQIRFRLSGLLMKNKNIKSVQMNLRRWIQTIFFALTILTGVRFYLYAERIYSGDLSAARPSGVEGFLPISALMGLKKLALTGQFDSVHPAGLVILLSAILLSIVFKKSFCSSVCPVGFVSEIVSKTGLNLRVPGVLFHILSLTKYLLLLFFAYIILWNMNIQSINAFMASPYNIAADVKMLNFFLHPSRTTLITLGALLVLTLAVTNFWCRFLCPYGALLGLFSALSPFKVRRDPAACTDCRACTAVCPMHINVHKKKTVSSPECFGCHECVTHRTQENCLQVTRIKSCRRVPVIVSALFFLIVTAAMLGGYWHTKVPAEMYRQYIMQADRLSH